MSSTIRAESDQAALGTELRELARRGFDQPDLVDLSEFPALLATTGLQAEEPGPRAAALHSILVGAITQLSARDQKAARLLTGLDPRASGQRLRERRRLAAESLGVAADTFRTHRESKLSEQLARALLVYVAAEAPALRAESGAARVFVIHRHGDPAHEALAAFLRALGLAPLDWSGLITPGENWRARMIDILRSALETSSAVIALITPDGDEDVAHTGTSPPRPNSNVLLELGLALGIASTKTVVVAAGSVDLPSDLAGVQVIQLSNATAGREALRTRLRLLGCPLTDDHLDWLDPAVAGDFEPPRKPRDRTAISRNAGDLVGDRYELLQRLGTGFSKQQLWTALDRLSGEHVVLTFWLTSTPGASEAIQRFLGKRAELEHPGVVATRAILAGEDHVVVVSDVVDGLPLGSTGRLSPEASVKAMIGVLDAVAALHARGYVHADLRPENILIARGGRPVLIDFGAAMPEESGARKTRAPGEPSEPPQASDDVYAVGRMLLSLLGATTAAERGGSWDDAIDRLEVSSQLTEVLRHVLSADPAQRPSAAELLAALRAMPEAAGVASGHCAAVSHG
jgi:predicted nucleotide-binding protein